MRFRAILQVGAFASLLAFAACTSDTPPASDATPGGDDSTPGGDDSTPGGDDSTTVTDPEVPRAQQRLDSLATVIEEAVGEARADEVSQCSTLAYGAKPCGGPWRYLVYSTAATDSTRLAWMVDEYNDTEDYLNRKLGRGSDCALVTEPDVALEDGRCVAAGGADG